MKNTSKVVKISLTLALMLFVFTVTPASSFFNIVKPASAAPLTSMSLSPMSNVINEMATYDFLFKTATTETIKTIEINFPSSFNVANIRLIEREGIGSGTLSFSGSTIKYTVGGSDSIPAGTNIRLEIARIIATAEGSFTVSVKTLDSQDGTIDGPTTSGPFIIKSITSADILDNTIHSKDIVDNTVSNIDIQDKSILGVDIDPSFMKSKELRDDDAGHAHGWNPNGAEDFFPILDSDVFVQSRIIINPNLLVGASICMPIISQDGIFHVSCDGPVLDLARLRYLIINLPENVVISSSASASPSPFDSLLDK